MRVRWPPAIEPRALRFERSIQIDARRLKRRRATPK